MQSLFVCAGVIGGAFCRVTAACADGVEKRRVITGIAQRPHAPYSLFLLSLANPALLRANALNKFILLVAQGGPTSSLFPTAASPPAVPSSSSPSQLCLPLPPRQTRSPFVRRSCGALAVRSGGALVRLGAGPGASVLLGAGPGPQRGQQAGGGAEEVAGREEEHEPRLGEGGEGREGRGAGGGVSTSPCYNHHCCNR
jgi:hypothetical protein